VDNPRPRRALRAIEDCALALDEKEYVLGEILCFSTIPEDMQGYAADEACVPLE